MDIIERKSQGIIGVLSCLLVLKQQLSAEDFVRFCELVPDGEELWLEFTSRRDAPNAPKDYNFVTFAHEMLSS